MTHPPRFNTTWKICPECGEEFKGLKATKCPDCKRSEQEKRRVAKRRMERELQIQLLKETYV